MKKRSFLFLILLMVWGTLVELPFGYVSWEYKDGVYTTQNNNQLFSFSETSSLFLSSHITFQYRRSLTEDLKNEDALPTKYVLHVPTFSSDVNMKYVPLISHEPIIILNDDDLLAYNFSGDGTAENPYIIEGYNISTSEDFGIKISGITKYILIRSCYISANMAGIYLSLITQSTITIADSVVVGGDTGLEITSGSVIIANSTFTQSTTGILISTNSFAIVDNSTCTENTYGISIISNSFAQITNSSATRNQSYGIKIYDSSAVILSSSINNNDYGVQLENVEKIIIYDSDIVENFKGVYFSSASGIIYHNNIAKNTYAGIDADSSSLTICNNNITYSNYGISIGADSTGNLITGNNISNNVYYGIFINSLCEHNNIYLNYFAENGNNAQAYDEAANNTWYNEELKLGNYWFNWTEITPYNIDGPAGAQDQYPINKWPYDTSLPKIENVNYSVTQITEKNQIEISATISDNVSIAFAWVYYRVNNNYMYVTPMYINGYNCSIILSPFDFGTTVEFYLMASDTSGNQALSEICHVEILDKTAPTIKAISYTPDNPTEQDQITVIANVVDNAAVTNVTLFYRINYGEWKTKQMILNPSLYETSIGPFDIDTIVEFYIVAVDASGNEALSEVYQVTISDGTAPTIESISYTPDNPTEQDLITIIVNVTDNVAVANVTLFYRINYGEWITKQMINTNGYYKLTIGSFKEGSIIEFYVTVTDTSNNTITSNFFTIVINDYKPTTTSEMTTSSQKETLRLSLQPLGVVLSIPLLGIFIQILRKKRHSVK